MRSLALLAALAFAQPFFGYTADLRLERTPEALIIKESGGPEFLRYWLQQPEGSNLSVESACFFHPLATPAGIPITDAAPADHPHHRGIFLAWVEMHGERSADFWGWGEHAPKQDRRIVNRRVSSARARGHLAAFVAENAWRAEGETMLVERLQAAFHAGPETHLLDLKYRLTPSTDLTLAEWAFSGFCVRVRQNGSITAFSPDGKIDLPDPVHTDPATDWPDAPWYAFVITLEEGRKAGVALLNHPENPPTRWHNHRQTRMLNPCITALGPLQLQRHEPLSLRYRVVAFDGELPAARLNTLAKTWSKLPD